MQIHQDLSASIQLSRINPISSRRDGQGSPVLLFHGIAASNLDWKFLTPLLVQHGFQVVSPDLPGHGESIKPKDASQYTYDWLYTNIQAWVEELRFEENLTLIGHSLGGLICLHLAKDLPDRVSRLVLIDPFFHPQQLSPLLRFVNRRPELCSKALEAAPPWLIQAVITMDINSFISFNRRTRWQIALDYKRASPHILHLARTIPEIVDDLSRISQPTLVIWGEKDLTLAPQTFPHLISTLPNARGCPVPGTGHQPHLALPEKVNRLILTFLREDLP